VLLLLELTGGNLRVARDDELGTWGTESEDGTCLACILTLLLRDALQRGNWSLYICDALGPAASLSLPRVGCERLPHQGPEYYG
jgi:hypothetical protein